MEYNSADYPDPELDQFLAEYQDGKLAAKSTSDVSQAVIIKQQQLQLIMQLDHVRRIQHLTMGQLAAKIGMNQASLSRIWSRKTDPKLSALLKIAEALEIRFVISGRHLVQ